MGFLDCKVSNGRKDVLERVDKLVYQIAESPLSYTAEYRRRSLPIQDSISNLEKWWSSVDAHSLRGLVSDVATMNGLISTYSAHIAHVRVLFHEKAHILSCTAFRYASTWTHSMNTFSCLLPSVVNSSPISDPRIWISEV